MEEYVRKNLGVSCIQVCFLIIPPTYKVEGVYWFHHICPTIRPSIHQSVHLSRSFCFCALAPKQFDLGTGNFILVFPLAHGGSVFFSFFFFFWGGGEKKRVYHESKVKVILEICKSFPTSNSRSSFLVKRLLGHSPP